PVAFAGACFGVAAGVEVAGGGIVLAGPAAAAAGDPPPEPDGLISRCIPGSFGQGMKLLTRFPTSALAAEAKALRAFVPPSDPGPTSKTLRTWKSPQCRDTLEGPISTMRSRMPFWTSFGDFPSASNCSKLSISGLPLAALRC